MNELATRGAVALDRAVDRAIAFLRAEQIEDGEFPSIVAPQPDMGGVSAPDTNYFTTPQVLWSLGFVFHRRPIATLRARATEFVERGCEAGAWRFFTPKVRRRIDPDVDTTACCAAAVLSTNPLYDVGPTLDALARARDEGGRFLTWIRSEGPNDVDAVANANALWLLGADERGAAAGRWLCAVIEGGADRATFPYYESPMALFHAASRALYTGARSLEPARATIRRAVLDAQRADGSFGNALETAFAVCALHNLGDGASSQAVRGCAALRAAQLRSGAWPDCAAWNGPELPAPRSLWWGGRVFTTALAVEALARAEYPQGDDGAVIDAIGVDFY